MVFCLLALTMLAIVAWSAISVKGHGADISAPITRLLDNYGHDACALARASECPPL